MFGLLNVDLLHWNTTAEDKINIKDQMYYDSCPILYKHVFDTCKMVEENLDTRLCKAEPIQGFSGAKINNTLCQCPDSSCCRNELESRQ